MSSTEPQPLHNPRLGLCADCRHSRLIESAKGSQFLLCQLSQSAPSFPKYPRLPILSCPGHSPKPGFSNDSSAPQHPR